LFFLKKFFIDKILKKCYPENSRLNGSEMVSWWKRQVFWKKIALVAVSIIILFLAFLNRPLLLNIVGWLGVVWRGETAVLAWQAAKKPFWQLLIIRSCLDFWGLFLTWFLTGLALKGTDTLRKKEGFFGKFLQKFEKQSKNPKLKKRLAWLEKKGNVILYLVMLFGFYIPFLPTAIMIVARARKIQHSLLRFGLLNFVRNTIVLMAIWKGISFFI